MANTNIYSITDKDYDSFIDYQNTNKVIVFYKKDCIFCKLQLDDLRKLAKLYNNNINYAICDVTKLKRFSIDHNILSLPTVHIYKNGELIHNHSGYLSYDELEFIIKEI